MSTVLGDNINQFVFEVVLKNQNQMSYLFDMFPKKSNQLEQNHAYN